ncbi:GNPNAT1 (predicted) [Pycnogonum litorale]
MEPLVMNGLDDVPLFSSSLLKEIDFSRRIKNFKPEISPTNPGDNLRMRPLSSGDFHRGYMNLLTALTEVGEVSSKQYLNQFEKMKNSGDYYIVVLEDTQTNEVIGSGTLLIELKFIHSTTKRGRIEDLVVNDQYRGRQLGKLIIETLTELSQYLGCYKVTLDCRDKLVSFYSRFGFIKENGNSNSMCIRFQS